MLPTWRLLFASAQERGLELLEVANKQHERVRVKLNDCGADFTPHVWRDLNVHDEVEVSQATGWD